MTEEATVSIEKAEQVNVDQPSRDGIPHVHVVASISIYILVGFTAVSAFILLRSDDAAITGAIVGTWTALATTAGGFWLGASSGGKLKR